MTERTYYPNIPKDLMPPFSFKDAEAKEAEGKVESAWDLVNKFEPVDVLNSALDIQDKNGKVIRIIDETQQMVELNEYTDKSKLYIVID